MDFSFIILQQRSLGLVKLEKVPLLLLLTISIFDVSSAQLGTGKDGWVPTPNLQYHVQTDEGPERYFRFQTSNGQYRKEKRLLDGTVIGTEGWLDSLGYLRLKDYIADSKGYRILRSKMLYVGKNKPVYSAIWDAKKTPYQNGAISQPARPPNPFRQSEAKYALALNSKDINSRDYNSNVVKPSIDFLPPASTSATNYYYNINEKNAYKNLLQYPRGTPLSLYEDLRPDSQLPSGSTEFPTYDGTHNDANGFHYYLKDQYHEEEQDRTGAHVGSFGYIDPFGIRRVMYYKTDPQSGGFLYQQNNKYVGFRATPYDLNLPKSNKHNI